MTPKKVKDGEGNSIDERRKNSNGYKYTWAAIIFLGLLFTTVTGWFFVAKGQTETKMITLEQSQTDIQKQLSQIQTDLGWIKDTLKDMKRGR